MDLVPGPEHQPKPAVRVDVDVSGYLEALEKVRAAVLFGWHEDLAALDDELGTLFRGQL
ncbi:hypothetical protein [Streptomyces similanensis]